MEQYSILSVAHQKYSLLATTHDCETGLLSKASPRYQCAISLLHRLLTICFPYSEKGLIQSLEGIYQKYIKKLQDSKVKDDGCPLCHRRFETNRQIAELIDEVCHIEPVHMLLFLYRIPFVCLCSCFAQSLFRIVLILVFVLVLVLVLVVLEFVLVLCVRARARALCSCSVFVFVLCACSRALCSCSCNFHCAATNSFLVSSKQGLLRHDIARNVAGRGHGAFVVCNVAEVDFDSSLVALHGTIVIAYQFPFIATFPFVHS